jgi:hypothetical protein
MNAPQDRMNKISIIEGLIAIMSMGSASMVRCEGMIESAEPMKMPQDRNLQNAHHCQFSTKCRSVANMRGVQQNHEVTNNRIGIIANFQLKVKL